MPSRSASGSVIVYSWTGLRSPALEAVVARELAAGGAARPSRRGVGSSHGREVRGQAGADPGGREQAVARLGDRQAPPRGGRRARVHVPGRADREGRPRARGVRRSEARHGVRRALGRRRLPRLRRDRRGVRRRPRPARALGRVRRRRGPRGSLHRHPPRSLLDGGRHLRVLARRVREGCRALMQAREVARS